MKLIAGLGNPGAEYNGTRHNVGFAAIDALATRLGAAAAGDFARTARKKFEGLALDGVVECGPGSAAGSEKVLLLQPMTYMNDSGRSVQAALAFYRLTPADLLVISDDVALPAGRIRLRADGSAGGHNGLADIERALGTDQYARLRIGIDAPPVPGVQRDYVLGRISASQRPLIEGAIARAVDAVLVWVQAGIVAAMNQFNAAPASGASESKG
jgi:peptidyl-tRNA hydrolase, PTH1 family